MHGESTRVTFDFASVLLTSLLDRRRDELTPRELLGHLESSSSVSCVAKTHKQL
jgi:hypothetical protein